MKYNQEQAYLRLQRYLIKCDLTYLKVEIKEEPEGVGLLSLYEINEGNQEIIAENIMAFICNEGYSDLTEKDHESICHKLTKKLMKDTDFHYSYYHSFRKILDKDYILFILNREIASVNSLLFSIESNSFHFSCLEKYFVPIESQLIEKAVIGQHFDLKNQIKDFIFAESQHSTDQKINYSLIIKYCEEYRKCIQYIIEKE